MSHIHFCTQIGGKSIRNAPDCNGNSNPEPGNLCAKLDINWIQLVSQPHRGLGRGLGLQLGDRVAALVQRGDRHGSAGALGESDLLHLSHEVRLGGFLDGRGDVGGSVGVRGVAVQVEFEGHILKPVIPLIGARFETRRLSAMGSYGSGGVNVHRPTTVMMV
jgi:hypothetical protein